MKQLPIKLNFYPISNQPLTFTVFRGEYSDQPKTEGYFREKLKEQSDSDQYRQYWITLNEEEGMSEFSFESLSNPHFTNRILWQGLIKRIEESELVCNQDYFVSDNPFHPFVSFVLSTYDEGWRVVTFEPYFLKSKGKFGFLADFRFKSKDTSVFNRRIQQLSLSLDSTGRSNRNYYRDKLDQLEIFSDQCLTNVDSFSIANQIVQIDHKLEEIESCSLEKRIYIFGDGSTSESQFHGLKDHDPYEKASVNPFYVFIFPEKYRSLANDVYSALSGRSFPKVFPGLEKMFGLEFSTDRVCSIRIDSYSKHDLEAIDGQLSQLIEDKNGFDLIGVFIEHDKYSQDSEDFSPYYFVKRMFTKRGLPVQAVTVENIRGKDRLKWSSSNLGLQVFAKLGGKPWKVKPSTEKCVILGLGSVHERDEEGKFSRFLAYSVCIDSSGLYRSLNILGRSSDKSTYLSQFSENIVNAIASQLSDDIHTCVVHVPFKVRQDEIRLIKSGLEALEKDHQDIRFLCLKVNADNKFFGFADNNSCVPYESTYITLSHNEYLIWLEGLHYGKENVFKKVGNPLHVEFLHTTSLNGNGLTAEMKKAFLQDVINLSGANWRGFNAKLLPISIYYPKLIAGYVSEFKKLNDTNDIDISDMAEPWFL